MRTPPSKPTTPSSPQYPSLSTRYGCTTRETNPTIYVAEADLAPPCRKDDATPMDFGVAACAVERGTDVGFGPYTKRI
ncbi:hypothetical protein GCM10009039_25920 [Halocalculus aciditolerans]|uniref:Uncharacterized protein n=1 Tax=Halocalculus aciditolerans TaxID=1383812 RepID=A0A830F948_9EURY|nr:hypothetical protein GCM10009039_25920 [Halocalculus aciditolerans]